MYNLYILLLFLFCYEEVLNYANLPLSNIKYIVALYMMYVLYRKGASFHVKIKSNLFKLYLLVLFFSMSRSLLDIPEFGLDGILFCKNYLWFPVLFYLFKNMPKYGGITYNEYFSKYINVVCSYIIINLVLYYVPLSFLITERQRFWGRISVGYPTIDVIIIASAFVFLFFNRKKWNVLTVVIKGLILIFGLLMQASGTGIVLLSVLFIIMIAYFLKIYVYGNLHMSKEKKSFVLLFLIITALGPFSVHIFKEYNSELYEQMYSQLENRSNILIGDEDKSTLSMNTMEIRQERFAMAEKKYLKDDLSQLFGIGYGKISTITFDNYHIFVEDQNSLNKITIGSFGNVVFFLLLINGLVSLFKNRKSDGFYLVGSIYLFFVVTTYTSCNLLSFGPIALWTLVYSYYIFTIRKI